MMRQLLAIAMIAFLSLGTVFLTPLSAMAASQDYAQQQETQSYRQDKKQSEYSQKQQSSDYGYSNSRSTDGQDQYTQQNQSSQTDQRPGSQPNG